MLEETGERSVEGLVAGEEAGEGQNAFATKLLDNTTLGEDDGENVSEGGEGDEDGEGTFSPGTEDIAEERGCKDTTAVGNLLAGHGSEVGDIDKHVENADSDDGNGGGALESTDGVLHLGHGVVGVAVANVGPDDVV